MWRSGLLIVLASVSVFVRLAPEVFLTVHDGVGILYKQITLQLVSLLASIPLLISAQLSFNFRPNAWNGLDLLFVWVAGTLQVALLASTVIHFKPWQENIAALQNYENASISELENRVFIDGVIGPNSYNSFVTKLNTSAPNALAVRSHGGLIDVAIDIASVVKQRGLPVHVVDYCDSSCVIIASASPQLSADFDAVFGFHRGNSLADAGGSWSMFVSEQATDQLISALRDNGIPEDILEEAMLTPPNQIYGVTAKELQLRGVVVSLNK